MRNVKPRPSGLVRFLNILIVLTALAAVISLVRLAGELRSAFDRDQYSSLEYYLQDGEYPGMIRQYYSRHYDIDPFPSAHEESYQAAGYADAAFQHQFFQKIGDQPGAWRNTAGAAVPSPWSPTISTVCWRASPWIEKRRIAHDL